MSLSLSPPGYEDQATVDDNTLCPSRYQLSRSRYWGYAGVAISAISVTLVLLLKLLELGYIKAAAITGAAFCYLVGAIKATGCKKNCYEGCCSSDLKLLQLEPS